jgi:uncharacterized protein DUF6527
MNMRTIKKVIITPVFVDFMTKHRDMEEGKIYISKKYGTSSHKCLCGCGELTVLPLNCIVNGVDHGWQLKEKDNKVTFTPSVGNFQLPCKSHYIITNNVANFV